MAGRAAAAAFAPAPCALMSGMCARRLQRCYEYSAIRRRSADVFSWLFGGPCLRFSWWVPRDKVTLVGVLPKKYQQSAYGRRPDAIAATRTPFLAASAERARARPPRGGEASASARFSLCEGPGTCPRPLTAIRAFIFGLEAFRARLGERGGAGSDHCSSPRGLGDR